MGTVTMPAEQYERMQELLRVLDELRCTDGGCIFRLPGSRGMVTNGGCRCLYKLPTKSRWALEKLIRYVRDLGPIAPDPESMMTRWQEQLLDKRRSEG